MDDHQHEYQHPLWMLISRFMCGLVMAVVVVFALPTELNFFLSIFLVAATVSFMEDLHINFIEKPRVREWHDAHVEKYHKDERRDRS